MILEILFSFVFTIIEIACPRSVGPISPTVRHGARIKYKLKDVLVYF